MKGLGASPKECSTLKLPNIANVMEKQSDCKRTMTAMKVNDWSEHKGTDGDS